MHYWGKDGKKGGIKEAELLDDRDSFRW